ncbi:hypothetical protein OS493_024975 [Desmophyllum pertusum]|uniref:Uncharacterized protein n=1 Tax=Desmophyllum pertusum TaxID=174260 RepID=A0A9W9YLF1_9CNID|nr:hypothetical protein OS493_024975 [Desmophyllum pertusum]
MSLENYRLSQHQSRNGPTASIWCSTDTLIIILKSCLSLSRTMLDTLYYQAHQLTLPAQQGTHRSPPQTGYPPNLHKSHLQDPYSEFSYHNSSRLHDSNLPPSGYLASDSRWQTPGFYDSHRHFDSRGHEGQFAASSREPDNVYYRSPDHYVASAGGQFYDRRPPTGEDPRNVPPDSRYMHPGAPSSDSCTCTVTGSKTWRHLMNPGQSCRGHSWVTETIPGLMVRMGIVEHYFDGGQGGYRGYADQRPAGFEPHTMERGIVNGRDEPTMTRCAFLSIDAYKMYTQFRMSVYMYCFGSVDILSILKFKKGIPPLVLATTQSSTPYSILLSINTNRNSRGGTFMKA